MPFQIQGSELIVASVVSSVLWGSKEPTLGLLGAVRAGPTTGNPMVTYCVRSPKVDTFQTFCYIYFL